MAPKSPVSLNSKQARALERELMGPLLDLASQAVLWDKDVQLASLDALVALLQTSDADMASQLVAMKDRLASVPFWPDLICSSGKFSAIEVLMANNPINWLDLPDPQERDQNYWDGSSRGQPKFLFNGDEDSYRKNWLLRRLVDQGRHPTHQKLFSKLLDLGLVEANSVVKSQVLGGTEERLMDVLIAYASPLAHTLWSHSGADQMTPANADRTVWALARALHCWPDAEPCEQDEEQFKKMVQAISGHIDPKGISWTSSPTTSVYKGKTPKSHFPPPLGSWFVLAASFYDRNKSSGAPPPGLTRLLGKVIRALQKPQDAFEILKGCVELVPHMNGLQPSKSWLGTSLKLAGAVDPANHKEMAECILDGPINHTQSWSAVAQSGLLTPSLSFDLADKWWARVRLRPEDEATGWSGRGANFWTDYTETLLHFSAWFDDAVAPQLKEAISDLSRAVVDQSKPSSNQGFSSSLIDAQRNAAKLHVQALSAKPLVCSWSPSATRKM